MSPIEVGSVSSGLQAATTTSISPTAPTIAARRMATPRQ